MTARAYAFCIGGAPVPHELEVYRAIEVFGVKAVTGKDVLTYAEIQAMRIANLVITLYQQREKSNSWGEWSEAHPKEAKFLEAAHIIYEHTNRI